MTWLEFKQKMESSGVKDGDDIWYIDVTLLGVRSEYIDVEKDDIGWMVWV